MSLAPPPPERIELGGHVLRVCGLCLDLQVWADFRFVRARYVVLWWACVCIIIYCNYPVSSETPSASRPRRETELSI